MKYLIIVLGIILMSQISLGCDDFSGKYITKNDGLYQNLVMEFAQKSCTDIELFFYKDEKLIESYKNVASFSEQDKKIISRECLGDKDKPPSPMCYMQTFRIHSWSKDGKTIYWAVSGITDGSNPLNLFHHQVHYRFADLSHNIMEQGGYILEAGENFLEKPRVTENLLMWYKKK